MIRVVFAERPADALPVLYDCTRHELTITSGWWRRASLLERLQLLGRFEAVRAQGLPWCRWLLRREAPPAHERGLRAGTGARPRCRHA